MLQTSKIRLTLEHKSTIAQCVWNQTEQLVVKDIFKGAIEWETVFTLA